ncbi:ABC transporter substrate-binding protein [Myxococcota bacterium]|nr:ABC transporter substrate-binding protein [Myxococcota bacterium]
MIFSTTFTTLTALIFLTGCGGGGPSAPEALVLGLPFDPGSLNPVALPYALSQQLVEQTQLPLARRHAGPDGLTFTPGLATAWTWSEDRLQLTFTLNPAARWDDGSPVTSADVAFTYTLIDDPAVASNWLADGKLIRSVLTPDATTVTFVFEEPAAELLLMSAASHNILQASRLKDADRASLRGHAYSRAPSSSGPYRVATWAPDDHLVLEPNPHSLTPPKIQRVIARVVPEYSTRILELERGALDLLMDVELNDVARLAAERPDLRLIRTPDASVSYIGWNLDDPRLTEPKLREALDLSIHREALIREMYTVADEPYARIATGSVAPSLGPWHNAALAPTPHDPSRARTLLAELGYADTNGDGVLDRDGAPLRIELLLQSGIPESQRLGVRVQGMLKEIGVALELVAVEPNRFSATAREGEFEAILWGFGNNPKVDLAVQWRSDGAYNWMSYSDPETDRLIDAARRATDPAEAQALTREIQARVHAARPASFLVWSDQVSAVGPRVVGAQMSVLSALESLETWTLATK